MKLGAESRTKVIVLIVLLVGAAISAVHMVSSLGNRPMPVAAAPSTPRSTTPQPPPRRATGRGPTAAVAAPSLDPELRLGLLQSSEGTKYEGTGRNIFVPALEPIPHEVAKGLKNQPPPPPPGPPPPPPIPLKFFGFASHTGEGKRVFLAQGEDVFIAEEGQIVDRRYKVVRINPASVEIEDMLNNNRQTIPLTQS
jgi:hypothetical protein